MCVCVYVSRVQIIWCLYATIKRRKLSVASGTRRLMLGWNARREAAGVLLAGVGSKPRRVAQIKGFLQPIHSYKRGLGMKPSKISDVELEQFHSKFYEILYALVS